MKYWTNGKCYWLQYSVTGYVIIFVYKRVCKCEV